MIRELWIPQTPLLSRSVHFAHSPQSTLMPAFVRQRLVCNPLLSMQDFPAAVPLAVGHKLSEYLLQWWNARSVQHIVLIGL